MATRYIDALDASNTVIATHTETNDAIMSWDIPTIFPSLTPGTTYNFVMRTGETADYTVPLPAFDPLTLYAGGRIGAFGFVGTTECWRDVARTQPAVVGQEVLSWRITLGDGTAAYCTASAGAAPTFRQDASGFYYLDFDQTPAGSASDDQMQSPALNWGSDEVTLIVAVSKTATNSTGGSIIEFSPSSSGNNGAFWLSTTNDNWSWRSKGTVAANASATGYSQPRTDVLTGIGKISTDQAILRVNGTQVASVATDQGTGNFGNFSLYFGRRADTSLGLQGRIYSFIAINKVLTGADLTNGEAWATDNAQVPFLQGEALEFAGLARDGIFAQFNQNWEGTTSTYSKGEGTIGGAVGYPALYRDVFNTTSGAANRLNASSDTLTKFLTYDIGFYIGKTARIYRVSNGAMDIVRESQITGGKIGQWRWARANGDQVLDATTFYHSLLDFSRPNVPYWYRVAAVGADGLSGAWSAPVSYSPSSMTGIATVPANPTKALNRTGSGGALPAPTGVATSAGLIPRFPVISWDPVAGAEGYIVEFSYYDPATNIDEAQPYLELAPHPTPILANDLVILEVEHLTRSEDHYSSRVYNAGEITTGRPPFFWFLPETMKRDGNDWAYVPFDAGDKPAAAFTDHFFRRIAAPNQTAKMERFWQGGVLQTFYTILEVGKTYRLRTIMRASSPVTITFTPGGTLTGTTFANIPSTWTEYTFDMTPTTAMAGSGESAWTMTFPGGASGRHVDIAYWEIVEVGAAPLYSLAETVPAQNAYLRDHTFIKRNGGFMRPLKRLIGNKYYNFKAFRDLCLEYNNKPWFQIEWNMPKEEWVDLVAYLAAPNGSHPMADLRLASGIPEPWTTTFPDMKLEPGNEAWQDDTNGFWTFPGNMTDSVTGAVYQGQALGAVAGLFWQMIADWMKESPYWSILAPKLTLHAGGWHINPFGEQAYRHFPDAKEVSAAPYIGGWETGSVAANETGNSFDVILSDAMIKQKALAKTRVDALKVTAAQIGKTYGTDVRYTIYEGGPGYLLPGANTGAVRVAEEVALKSRAAGVATIDGMLTYAQQDFKNFNYFTVSAGDRWASHGQDIDGNQEYITHALVRIIHENIAPARVYGAATEPLGTRVGRNNTGGTGTINQIGAYQLRNLADPSKRMIVLVNRNLDPSQLDPADPAYSATPAGTRLFNVQTNWDSATSLRAWTAGIGPYRQHNRYPVGQRRDASGNFISDPLCVSFNYAPTTLSVPSNIKDFPINASVGATANGLPAGNCLILLFEGVTGG